MTGFGAAAGQVGSSQVTVEVRTVNHRFFTPSIKLPSSLSRWEGEIREALRRRVARGHVTLTARIERAATGELFIDESRFAASVRALKELQERYALSGPLDVATVLRMPDVLGTDGGEADAGSPEQLTEIVDRALAALTQMREAEGSRLAAVLDERLSAIEQRLARIAERAPERLVSERERLRRSVHELANGLAVDESRLAQEIALLADRLDVSEELDRFRAHVAAFRDTVSAPATGQVGKRLGFLLQEMLREVNTTGSKAKDTVMLHEVVAIKEELERLSEQIENIE
ncbi:MAG TPA: YicC/YloC family endoribonuclease [Gemmatimonadaceae bacterium]|nr:YicC/YloC family endoribonuclease [Gemmatimonadaceae bacterium]